jgi:NAD(P)-dependent dehydrogenase (short-subunit alcohol dehydrogenase family)
MDGRVALITGSSRGLGRAMAIKFAESGAHVCIVGRREDQLKATAKEVDAAGDGKVCAVSADMWKADDIERMVKTAEKELGPVDILVNNAGSSQRGEFLTLTDEDWKSDLELKLFGAIRACRHVIPGMQKRKWGRIINVLNTGAKATGPAGYPTAVSRSAGMSLMKGLAGEFAKDNILVNGLLVGRIESDQWLNRYEASNKEKSYDEFLLDMAKTQKLPMGRLGTAEEFANMAAFLCSDAGSYITGCAINVDGGLCPVV